MTYLVARGLARVAPTTDCLQPYLEITVVGIEFAGVEFACGMRVIDTTISLVLVVGADRMWKCMRKKVPN